MNKKEFLRALQEKLSALPRADAQERLIFYSEMIDDRMEEGLSEAEAVASLGSVARIAGQILGDIPAGKKTAPAPTRRMKTWERILLVLGSPMWIPLLIAALAVVFSLYASAWSVILSFWAVFASLAGCALGLTLGGLCFALFSSRLAGIAMIGAGIFCAGLSIFAFYGCRAVTKGAGLLTKKTVNALLQKRGNGNG